MLLVKVQKTSANKDSDDSSKVRLVMMMMVICAPVNHQCSAASGWIFPLNQARGNKKKKSLRLIGCWFWDVTWLQVWGGGVQGWGLFVWASCCVDYWFMWRLMTVSHGLSHRTTQLMCPSRLWRSHKEGDEFLFKTVYLPFEIFFFFFCSYHLDDGVCFVFLMDPQKLTLF